MLKCTVCDWNDAKFVLHVKINYILVVQLFQAA